MRGCCEVAWRSAALAAALGAVWIGAEPSGVGAVDVRLATDRTVYSSTGFTSPSGNIGCYIEPGYVRCDIRERDWAPPPKPASCPVGWGQGVAMRTGTSPTFVCAGDTALGGGPALAYGDTISAGSLQCQSSPSGMACWDIQHGTSFSISREAYELN
jgi:uncharacterized protein DUF6636